MYSQGDSRSSVVHGSGGFPISPIIKSTVEAEYLFHTYNDKCSKYYFPSFFKWNTCKVCTVSKVCRINTSWVILNLDYF